jgi:L-ascorbate metabolism protein UlaG (beta-lactamase superfamily)
MRAGLVAGVVALAFAASANAHVLAGARGGDPLVRAVSQSDTVKARQRYFGAANVDATTGAVRRDKLILSWFGVTNFAMAIRGHVVLLDAWVPRGGTSSYVPSSPQELAQLAPELIFIGHAHFDHAADATPIAEASGATLVGNAEQCAELQGRATRAMPPRCIVALPRGAAPGTRAAVGELRGVDVTIVKHLHSALTPPAGDDAGFHVPVLPLPSTTQLEHPPTPKDLIHLLGHLPDAEAGTNLYRFAVGDFSLVWNDSAGPLADKSKGTLDVLKQLRPVDVHVGAIQGFNQFTNGVRDAGDYIEAIGAPVFVPSHHDDWAAGITTKGANYRAPLDAELATIAPGRRPQVRFISDPADYVRPAALTFDVAFDPVRVTRRCVGKGRLRVGLAGDTADVTTVELRLGSAVRRGPAATFSRSVVRANRGRRVQAVVTDAGVRRTLRRTLPSCGVRR